MSELLPCPACHRHLRASTSVCPFCEAPQAKTLARRSFAVATAALGASAVLSGCDALAPAYGGPPMPPPTTPSPSATTATSGRNGPLATAVPAYGAPPIPTGSTAASSTHPNAAASAREGADMYGAPPPPANSGTLKKR